MADDPNPRAVVPPARSDDPPPAPPTTPPTAPPTAPPAPPPMPPPPPIPAPAVPEVRPPRHLAEGVAATSAPGKRSVTRRTPPPPGGIAAASAAVAATNSGGADTAVLPKVSVSSVSVAEDAKNDSEDPAWATATAQLPTTPKPATADETGPGEQGSMRDWLKRYGWLVAAGSVALIVLACSSPLVSNAGLPWYSGNPGTTVVQPPAPTQPPPTATPTAPPPSGNAAPPVIRRTKDSRRNPTGETTKAPTATQRPAVLLGPGDGRSLQFMLMAYCYTQRGMREAQLRSGVDPAQNNWECRGNNRREPIDLQAACRWRYGAGTIAKFTDAHNAYTWRCYRP